MPARTKVVRAPDSIGPRQPFTGGRGPHKKGDRVSSASSEVGKHALLRATFRRMAPIVAAVCVATTGCASTAQSDMNASASPLPSASESASRPSAVPSLTNELSARPTGGAGPQLTVLANVATGVGLWTYNSDGTWTAGPSVPGATAISRDGQLLILAGQGSLQVREVSKPQTAAGSLAMKWESAAARGRVACVDRSASGKTVVAVSAVDALTFAVVGPDGFARVLSPSPSSPFGPSVAWLDEDRLVALSADPQMISRLAVVDTANHSVTVLQGLPGIRTFGMAPDRRSLAAATESDVYVASIASWLAERQPKPAVTLEPGHIVWDLAISGDGSRLAMLSGTEAADGTVGAIHELVYEATAGSWKRIASSPAPFTGADGQVWLV